MKNKLWLLFILITVVTWGVWGAFSDLQMDKEGIPETVVYILWALTMIPCAIVALIINKGKFLCNGKSALLGCTVGLLGAGGQLVLFKALAIGPAYIIFPFISMSPVVVITLAALFLKEKANRWQIAGIIVALIAILLLSIQTGGDNSPVSGWLWIVLAVLVLFAWGIQGFFMKFANNSMDAESIFVWMAISGLVLIPVAWFMDSDPMTAAEYFAQDGVMVPSLTCFGIQILNAIG
ncbi:MAG: EamA family transporter, partial [Paludibacteraceae bacterium]|nr:EamA family transporter [Paludibacteraceae bacterium]